jgi:hypothetical protein
MSYAPSKKALLDLGDTAIDGICALQALTRAKWAVPWVVGWAVLFRLYLSSEDYVDLWGTVESVEDSHRLESVVVEDVVADRKHYPATPVAGTTTTKCEDRTKKKPDGTVEHYTVCRCTGPTLEYVWKPNQTKQLACGGHAGECPTGNGFVTEFVDGRRVCSFSTDPIVHCKINGSKDSCTFRRACPAKGETVTMARRVKDDTLWCSDGDWNTCRVTVSYAPPNGSALRKRTFSLRMNTAGAAQYKDGDPIQLYYSFKQRRVFLDDKNVAAVLGWIVAALTLYTSYKVADAVMRYKYRWYCLLRTGEASIQNVGGKLAASTGIDIR